MIRLADGVEAQVPFVEAIVLRADVDGVDEARFAELAKTAEETCPVSKALAGTTITLDATLEG